MLDIKCSCCGQDLPQGQINSIELMNKRNWENYKMSDETEIEFFNGDVLMVYNKANNWKGEIKK